MSEQRDGRDGAMRLRRLSPVIHDFAYDVWPGAAWVLPTVGVVCSLFSSGAAGLGVLFFGWLAIPACALLGVMPRWIARRNGVMHSDESETWVLFVHWWAIVAIAVHGFAAASIRQNMLTGATILAVLMWLGLLGRARQVETSAPSRSIDTTLAWLALAMGPIVIVVLLAIGR